MVRIELLTRLGAPMGEALIDVPDGLTGGQMPRGVLSFGEMFSFVGFRFEGDKRTPQYRRAWVVDAQPLNSNVVYLRRG